MSAAAPPIDAGTAAVHFAPDAIVRLAPTGRVLYANRTASRLLGCDANEIVGRDVLALGLPAAVAKRYRRGVRGAVRSGLEANFDFSIATAGAERHYTARIVPEADGDRRVDSALVVTYDRTRQAEEEQRRERLLVEERAAREKAEQAAQVRDRFLAIVSHELRSPLNGIQSWSHVLENQLGGRDRAAPMAMRALEGIRAGVDQQVALIEHLLDATAAMTGDFRLVRGSMILREAIERAVMDVWAAAIAKDVSLQVDMRLEDQRMDGDAHRVCQIFGQLLSNALKFTPNGGSIWVTAGREGTTATIVVRDSGRGLDAGFEQWLFEPFRQADSSSTRRAGGIGLGLALARRIAELHGGRLVADSAGRHLGSTFTVRLPIEAHVEAPAATVTTSGARHSQELAGIGAVVVDDQVEAREALRALLSQFGARVEVAPSSQAALDLIDRLATMPDVVICDIAMPDEDGYGFLRRLRAYEEARARRPAESRSSDAPAPTIPVIALSAFAELLDRPGAPGINFDCHLAKPVGPDQLLATLLRVGIGRAAD